MPKIHGTHRGALSGALAIVALAVASVAGAGFVPVEDFEALAPGPIAGQGGWESADASTAVVSDPVVPDNHVLEVMTVSTYLRRVLLVPDGTTRMLFFRVRYAAQLSISFGMSGYRYPSQFGDFEPELGLVNTGSDLRINDDGNYDVLTTLEPDTWHNVWLLIDNQNDGSRVWLHHRAGGDAGPSDQLAVDGQDFFIFRSGSAGDLLTFFVKTGGGSGVQGPIWFDDIHLEDTDQVNLSNPVQVQVAASAGDPLSASMLVAARPNPFNPRVTIRFALPASGHARLSVYDIAGRLVRQLVDAELPRGAHEASWDGRDTAGRAVATGNYRGRLETGQGIATVGLSLIR